MRKGLGYFARLQYASDSDERPDAHTLQLQVNLDGSAWLFCGRAAEMYGRDSRKEFFSSIVAGNTTRFLAMLGDLYQRSSYLGMVDTAVSVTGLKGSLLHQPRNPFSDLPRYEGQVYQRAHRTSAAVLKDGPRQVAAELLMPLMDAMSQGKHDPFKET